MTDQCLSAVGTSPGEVSVKQSNLEKDQSEERERMFCGVWHLKVRRLHMNSQDRCVHHTVPVGKPQCLLQHRV